MYTYTPAEMCKKISLRITKPEINEHKLTQGSKLKEHQIYKEISEKNARITFLTKLSLTFASSSKSFNHLSTPCLNFAVKSKPSSSRPGVRLSQFLDKKK